MERLNLAKMRPFIAKVAGVCPPDPRIPDWLNESQERLMSRGKWVGSVQRYRFCTSEACLTLPRQIETVEAWWLCDQPMQIRDKWYETLENGPGQASSDCGCPKLIDRGTACSFRDISGSHSLIHVLAAVTESAGKRILLQGYDENAQWIRTQDAGTWVDGEYVNITTAGARTTKVFTTLTGAVKPTTNGPVNLFEWPLALGSSLHQLAYYESDETHPIYRRYLVPGMANVSACSDAQDECADKTVTLLAKLRHIDVVNDNDWLILGCRPAFKLMVKSILEENKQRFDEALGYEARAVAELEHELSSFEGDGVIPVFRVQDPAIFGGGSIENVISVPIA